MDGIEIAVDRIGVFQDIALFRVRGYVDTTTSPELQRLLLRTMEEGVCQFIVDLGFVNYVSSAGWGVFVGEIRGLREKGGDLKIIQMTPDVFEVFEMLEFNRILQCYDSLEEAIDDYEISRGLDLRSMVTIRMDAFKNREGWPQDTKAEEWSALPPIGGQEQRVGFRPALGANRRQPGELELPLTEKVKKLVTENPLMGPWAIRRQLYSPRFGYTRVGYFKLCSLMKRIGLDTKAKRYRFYRSR
ncbi:MAG TPA: STAS domain-containing protein [bacterium]|nr:STAS domain-containing protein [bacterium]